MFKKIAVLAIVGFAFVAANSIACEGPECVDLWTDGGTEMNQHEGTTFVPLGNNGGALTNFANQGLGMWADIGGSRGGDREGTVDVIARQGQTLETAKQITGGELFSRSDEFQEGMLNLEGTRGFAFGDANTRARGLVIANGGEEGGGLKMMSTNQNLVGSDATLCTTRNGSGSLVTEALNENGHTQELSTPDSLGTTFSYTGVRTTTTLGVNKQ